MGPSGMDLGILCYLDVYLLYSCLFGWSALFVWRIDIVTPVVVIYLSKHYHYQVCSLLIFFGFTLVIVKGRGEGVVSRD
jgi:hypothetical protein